MSEEHIQVTSSPSHPFPRELWQQELTLPLFRCRWRWISGAKRAVGMLSLPAVGGLSPWQSSRSQFAAFPIQGFISGEAELSGRLLSKVAIKVTPPAVIFLGFI